MAQYTIKPGDNLSKISKELGVSIKELQLENKIKNPDIIIAGKTLNYTPGNQGSWPYNIEQLKELNKLPDKEKIITYNSQVNPNKIFVVEDKASHKVYVYKGSKLIKTYNSVSGKNKGDDLTVTYTDKAGNIISGKGNMSTPAGVFSISGKGNYHGVPSFTRRIPEKTIKTKTGEIVPFEVPSSIHVRNVPLSPQARNTSNGCTGLSGNCMADLSQYIDKGTPYYILPEDQKNRFELRGSGLAFISGDPSKLPSYIPNKMREVNIITNIPGKSSKPKNAPVLQASIFPQPGNKITQVVDKIKAATGEALNEAKATFGADPKAASKYDVVYSSKKKELMKELGINTDTYDQLARLSLGILGQESGYGKPGLRGTFGLVRDQVAMALHKNPSVGVSQIRLTNVAPEIRKKYNINSTKDLLDTEKSAIAALALLADIKKFNLPTIKKKYPNYSDEELIALFYNNPQSFIKGKPNFAYSSNVLKNLQNTTVNVGNELLSLKDGGKINWLQTYKKKSWQH